MLTYTEAIPTFQAAFGGFVPARTTFARWARIGIRRGARVVRLEAQRIGGRWFTTPDAITRFAAALNDASTNA